MPVPCLEITDEWLIIFVQENIICGGREKDKSKFFVLIFSFVRPDN